MIYIAGSFSNQEEKQNLNSMIKWVREQYPEHELFIPMEHFIPGGNDKDKSGNYVMPNKIWGRKVFEMDIDAINECDFVVCMYNGRISGTGTAWEIGYAYGIKKPIVEWIADSANIASVMCFNSASIRFGNINIEQK